MRITILTHTPGKGGSTSLLAQMREYFISRGHATTVVVGSDSDDAVLENYVVVPKARARGWRCRLQQYQATIEQTKPEVVYSMSGRDEFDVLRFLRYPRIRHCSSLEKNPYTDIRFWLKQLAGYREAITANTPDVLEQIRSYGIPDFCGLIAPYRFAADFLSVPESRLVPLAEKKPVVEICFVGRFDAFLKRAHWLPAIIKGIEQSHPHLRWHLYGSGPCEAKLRHDLRLQEGQGTVCFHGWCNAQQLSRQLPAHDIFFLCSRSEGLPIAMVEAMLCGLACVVPAIAAGITFALGKGGGWLYEANSPRDAIDALRHATADAARLRQKRAEARQLAHALFAGPVVEEQLRRLEAGILKLAFNGRCLQLEQAPRLWAVRPCVSLRRRLLSALGYPPERY